MTLFSLLCPKARQIVFHIEASRGAIAITTHVRIIPFSLKEPLLAL